ncbi:MAG TPA: fumarate hydrolyase, partial [Anaerolineae bacterium]|nr:fumarate hydrolyase [Anaerolineae bacterium]
MLRLTTPISDEEIRSLKIGDTVYLNGIILTGRDAAHKFMIEHFIRNEPQPEEVELDAILKELLDG